MYSPLTIIELLHYILFPLLGLLKIVLFVHLAGYIIICKHLLYLLICNAKTTGLFSNTGNFQYNSICIEYKIIHTSCTVLYLTASDLELPTFLHQNLQFDNLSDYI